MPGFTIVEINEISVFGGILTVMRQM